MSSRAYTVRARWDEVSKTWWTDGEDIPGLCCQAGSFEELIEAVLALAPELLRDNGIEPPGQAVEIYRDRQAACYGVYRRLTALLREAGRRFERQGKGSHEIWFSPITKRTFTVPSNIRNRVLANAILKQAGLPNRF